VVNVEALERAVSNKSPMRPPRVAATDQGLPKGLPEDSASLTPLIPAGSDERGAAAGVGVAAITVDVHSADC
jgi:hypothetical protein